MKIPEILERRLTNLQLFDRQFTSVDELLQWMGPVQAQNEKQAKQALRIRLDNGDEATIENEVENEKIVKTWLLRGTIHFVSANDVGWILKLISPGIVKSALGRYKRLELDTKTLTLSNGIIEKTLSKNPLLTRIEIANVLAKKINLRADGLRLGHILHRAAMEGILAFRNKNGKEYFGSLPSSGTILSTDEAIGTLAKKYFQSHGPATLHDFVFWSGLTITQARMGISAVKESMQTFTLDSKQFYFFENERHFNAAKTYFHLLPGFDEYIVGYRHRELFLDDKYKSEIITANGIFRPTILRKGLVIGTWQMPDKGNATEPILTSFEKIGKNSLQQLKAAFGQFR